MEIVNASITDTLNTDMTNKEDLINARNVWETKLISSLDKLKGIGDFKENSSVKNASLQALKTYLDVVSKNYKRLIKLRGLNDKAGLNEINQNFEKTAMSLNATSEKFAKRKCCFIIFPSFFQNTKKPTNSFKTNSYFLL